MDPKTSLLPWQAAGMTNKKKSWSLDAVFSRAMNDLTIWCLQHPNLITKVILYMIYILESLITQLVVIIDPQQTIIYNSRLKHVGPNFCGYAKVVVGEHSEVAKIILSPQGRGPFIAFAEMVPEKFPKNTLLFMSDKEAGGDGSREKLKALVNELFHSPAVVERSHGAVAKRIVAEFAQLVVDISKQRVIFGRPKLGAAPAFFVAKYITHVVLGYDADDALAKRFAAHIIPYFFTRLIPFGIMKPVQPSDKWALDAIANSPLLQGINYNAVGLSRDYVANALLPIIFVAAIPGPNSFINFSLPNLPPRCPLSATNRESVYQTVLEVLRLNPAVGTVCTISTKRFSINIGGKIRKFPEGTPLCYSTRFACTDPNVYPDPLKFDASRTNLKENIINFASVGERNYGRQCPGREIAETMAVDLYMELGRLGWKPASVE